jgi:hypothetical protein
MGHLTNAKGFRVGKIVPWDYREHRYKGEGLKSIYFFDAISENIKRKLARYFRTLKFGLVFSHCKIKRSKKKILIKLYVFNGQFDTYIRELKSRLWDKSGKAARYLWRKQAAKKRKHKFTYFYFWKRPPRVQKRRRKLRRRGKSRAIRGRYRRRSKKTFGKRSNLSLKREFALKSTLKYWVASRKRGRGKIAKRSYKGLTNFLSKRLGFDFRNYFKPRIYPFKVKLVHLDFNTLTAKGFAEYVLKRLDLQYTLPSIVRPLYKEAYRSPDIRGLFFKFKGRYSRKPRSAINKKVFRYGKVAFSTVESKVDYFYKRFENRFGTCSIKVWLARF